jgi:alpha-1,6-mannosyltransferase
MERVVAPQLAAVLAALAGLLTAVWLRNKSDVQPVESFAWPMAASLFCAPVVYPWYLLWLLPFLRSVSTLPLVIWTVSIIPTYVVWHLRTLGRPWAAPGWVMLLEYGSVAMTAAILGLRRLKRP